MIGMPQEAQLINRLFHQHKVQCRVVSPPASYQTATLRLYRLQRGRGVPVSKVTGLADELDEALTHLRRRPVQVRFERLPLRLEVPRPDPRALRLQGVLERLSPEHFEEGWLLAVVGEGHTYGQSQMILLDDRRFGAEASAFFLGVSLGIPLLLIMVVIVGGIYVLVIRGAVHL